MKLMESPWNILNLKRRLRLSKAHKEMFQSSTSDFLIRREVCTWASHQKLVYRNFISIPLQKDQELFFSYWDQGMDTAPPLVKRCIETHRKYLGEKYILLDNSTISDWVDIPIEIKQKRSQMSTTHFSDILRLLLLEKYGGTWIDATVYLTGKPELLPDLNFFVSQGKEIQDY